MDLLDGVLLLVFFLFAVKVALLAADAYTKRITRKREDE